MFFRVLSLLCLSSCNTPSLRVLMTPMASATICMLLTLLFKRFYLFIFQREGKGGRKRERETSMCGCLSHAPPHWGPGPQPRHVPNWESNQRPFGSQAGTQSTEPHQPGLLLTLKYRSLSEMSFWFPHHMLNHG